MSPTVQWMRMSSVLFLIVDDRYVCWQKDVQVERDGQ